MAPTSKVAALCAALVLAVPLRADDADDRYRFLAGLVEKGLNELAVDEARGFLEEYPRHPKADLARYRLASALFALGRLDEASPYYGELCSREDFEYRAECLFRSAQCALAADRLDEAHERLEAVLTEPQDYLHPAALYLLGECAQRSGDLGSAERRYGEVLSRAPDSDHAHAARRALVWVAWQGHDLERTVELATRYLQRHGSDADADEVRVLSGEALLELGRAEEALAAYGRVAEAGSAREAALRGTGYAEAALGRHAEAAAAFERLVRDYPAGRFADEARLQRGVQLLSAGDARGAEQALRTARAEDPEVLFWLSRAQEQGGDLEGALRTLEQAVGREPQGDLATRIGVARGALYQKLGRTDDALAAFEGADSDYALAAAAVAGLNAGDAANAERLARRLLERSPQSSYRPQALFVLAEAAFLQGNHAAARDAFAAALAEPEDAAHAARALSRLGWCAYLTGDPRTAADWFERVAREHPGAPQAEEALYMLGRASDESAQAPRAAEAWRAYLERHAGGPHEAEVLYALSQAQGDEGRALLERLVSAHQDSELASRALFDLAEGFSRGGDAASAEKAYQDLLARSPEGPLADRARYGLAWVRHEGGQSQRALPLLAQVAENPDADPELRKAALELSIWAHADAGDPEGAEEAWRAFVDASADDPERYRATRRLAEAWRAAGRAGRAREAYETLLKEISTPEVAVDALVEGAFAALEEGDRDRAEAQVRVADRQGVNAPRVAEAAFFVGETHYDAGEDARAVELYRLAARTPGPFRDDALYKLGFAWLREEDLDQASEAFATLVQSEPQSELLGESLFLLGETRYRQQRYADAYEVLARLRREFPGHEVIAKALFRLGLACGHLERWGEAEEVLAALAKDHADFPNLAEAELWRGKALAAQRKPAARAAFDRVVALDRGALAAEARLETGRLLRRDGRTEDSLAEFLKVAVLYEHPEHVPAALLAAGECLEELGDPAKARERYREVLADFATSASAEAARAALERLESQ